MVVLIIILTGSFEDTFLLKKTQKKTMENLNNDFILILYV